MPIGCLLVYFLRTILAYVNGEKGSFVPFHQISTHLEEKGLKHPFLKKFQKKTKFYILIDSLLSSKSGIRIPRLSLQG